MNALQPEFIFNLICKSESASDYCIATVNYQKVCSRCMSETHMKKNTHMKKMKILKAMYTICTFRE